MTPDSFVFLKRFTSLINSGTENPDLLRIKETGANYQIMRKIDDLVFQDIEPGSDPDHQHVLKAINDLNRTIILDKTEKESHRYPMINKHVVFDGIIYFEIYTGFSDDLVDLGIAIAREKTKNVFKLQD